MTALIKWFRDGCPVPQWLSRKIDNDHARTLREAARICHQQGEYDMADELRRLARKLES